MLEIIGDQSTSEYEVAALLGRALLSQWSEIESSPREIDHVKIVAGAKISGYPVSDIDIVLVARFSTPRRFIPKRVLKDNNGRNILRKPIEVWNLLVAIEVKDHDAERVRFVGDDVAVQYTRGVKSNWKSATDQNIKQVHSLAEYLADRQLAKPFVYRSLVLRGLQEVRCSGALPRTFDGPEFLTCVASTSPVRMTGGRYSLASTDNATATRALELPLFKQLKPSNLDRRRMDAIVSQSSISSKCAEMLGQRMSIIKGHGGTGKTILLLQTVIKAFEERGHRSVILTYNVALASDIRRSLTLLGVPSDPEDGGIAVMTVMALVHKWLQRLEVIEQGVDLDTASYQKACGEAVELIAAGALTGEDLEAIKAAEPDALDFDNVAIDEGQDWPLEEARLILNLYDVKSVVVADGIDQVLRGKRTAWDAASRDSEIFRINLDTSLRMKSNLSKFANAVAEEVGLNWKTKNNPVAGGGNVHLFLAPQITVARKVNELIEKSKSSGNSPLDSLVCVPSENIIRGSSPIDSSLSVDLLKSGLDPWRGTDPLVRKNFPKHIEQCRVVHYESCRGLEGWVTVLHHLDDYWQECADRRMATGLSEHDRTALVSLEELSWRYAWGRVMIALTRPIDTLLITLKSESSALGKALLSLAARYPDQVTVLQER